MSSAESGSGSSSSSPRLGCLSWEEYFMAVACLSGQRSKDPVTQVGCCIVDSDNRIVGVGYNGMPTGCSDAVMPWGKGGDPLASKHLYVCHAEMNAIMNKNSASLRGCTMYVALFPCNECTKLIIQSRIAEVVYLADKNAGKVGNAASKRMLEIAGVACRKFEPRLERVVVEFFGAPTPAVTSESAAEA